MVGEVRATAAVSRPPGTRRRVPFVVRDDGVSTSGPTPHAPETNEAPTMRRTIPLAAVVAVVLALTACGGDPEPAASTARPAARAASSASASASSSPSASGTDAGGLYVALGDSLAAGYQPGGAELRDTAYPALTATRLSAAGDELTLENLGLQRRDDHLARQGRQVRLRRGQPARAGREAAEGQ